LERGSLLVARVPRWEAFRRCFQVFQAAED
jgi:hypothetical protein